MPVTLDDAVTAAEARGPDSMLLSERTRQQESLRGQAWSLLAPKVVANGSYTENEHEVVLDPNQMIPDQFKDLVDPMAPIVVQPKHYWQASVTVQQPIFNGQAVPLLFGAYRTVDAARLDETASRQQLRAGVATAYYGVFTAREAESLTEAAEATAKDQLDLAKRQVDAEMAPPRAILQAELAMSQASRDVQGAHQQRIQAEEAFHQLTGLERDAPLVLPAPVQVPADLDAAVEAARANRPDVAAAGDRVVAARYQARAHWIGWTPDVNARFTYAYTQNTGFSDDKTIWIAVVEANWTLWDGGYRLAKAKDYAAQVHMAEVVESKQVDAAEGAVRNAWERYHRAEAAVSADEREQALAEENLRLAKLGFEAGNTTWYEVEQAELGVRAAKLGALVETMNRDLAAIDLRVAVGDY